MIYSRAQDNYKTEQRVDVLRVWGEYAEFHLF